MGAGRTERVPAMGHWLPGPPILTAIAIMQELNRKYGGEVTPSQPAGE